MQLMVLCTVKVLCIVFGCFLPKLLSQVYFCAIMSELGHFHLFSLCHRWDSAVDCSIPNQFLIASCYLNYLLKGCENNLRSGAMFPIVVFH